ncbi:MAG: hypothetical protein ISQ08_00205 [Planctomycetes bacterium]|nr:hypothetical protein [Planctomycetota bacterium]MDA0947847.1 hypothetical protein [Planctomycetota bacterium]
MSTHSERRGLTLVELLTATLLAAFIMTGLVRLLDLTLDMWSKGEVRRDGIERTNTLLGLLADDLRNLHGGASGDLVVDWQPFDHDADGLADRVWPRLRLVRQVGAAAVQHLESRAAQEALLGRAAEGEVPEAQAPDGRPPTGPLPEATGLVEVAWVLVPDDSAAPDRYRGVLLRGERLFGDSSRDSLLDPALLAGGAPEPGALDEVARGVLWLGIELATQTTVLANGWEVGPRLADACTAWDARAAERVDPEVHARNELGKGMPAYGGRPLLPRRVRLVLELEREKDIKRRTRLLDAATAVQTQLQVDDERRLPQPGGFILIDGEWMEVLGIDPGRVRVRRGVRETAAHELPAGALIHYGASVTTEVPILLHEDDWRLGG